MLAKELIEILTKWETNTPGMEVLIDRDGDWLNVEKADPGYSTARKNTCVILAAAGNGRGKRPPAVSVDLRSPS